MKSELITLLLSQFIAYVISNFIFVPSYYIHERQSVLTNRYYRSFVKALIFFLFSFFLSIRADFIIGSIIMSIIVGLVNFFLDKTKNSTANLLIAQIIQVSALFIVVHLHNGFISSYDLAKLLGDFLLSERHLWYLTAYLLCLGPANVMIKLLLKTQDLIPKKSENDDSLLRAGRFIGNIERVITITLVFNNQYEAIGLFIAAKSLIRIKEGDKALSEYVLVGTLLSFGIAIMIGLAIEKVMKY
jgi:hypothetical protein